MVNLCMLYFVSEQTCELGTIIIFAFCKCGNWSVKEVKFIYVKSIELIRSLFKPESSEEEDITLKTDILY